MTKALEWLGALSGLVCVWGYAHLRWYGFVWGAVSAALYVVVFGASGLYGDTLLSLYFLVMNVWTAMGWQAQNSLRILVMKPFARIVLAFVVLTISLAMGLVFSWIPGSQWGWWSSAIASLNLAGQWLLYRRYLECWWLWMLANLLSVGLYLVVGLYPTAVLYLLYLGLAVAGFRQWSKALSQ